MNKNIVKVILVSITFVGAAVLGYILMPSISDNNNNGNDEDTFDILAPKYTNDAQLSNNKQDNTPRDSNINEDAKEDKDVNTETPALNVSTKPEIKSTYVAPRTTKAFNKIGLDFTVTASVESEDQLRYELYETGGSVAKYTSTTGVFTDVYPVDTGKYTLKVVNTRTNDYVETEVSGFNKINKYSASELQRQLNSDTQEKLFFHHFDNNKLRFDCDGADSADGIGALLEKREAFGWVLTVVGTPQYDDYNRIVYFRVKVE